MVRRAIGRDRLASILILLTFGVLVYQLAADAVWTSDAIEYSFVVPEDRAHNSYERIESLADVVRSQCMHYQKENGRVVIHFIVQVVVSFLGQGWFAVCNGAMFILLVVLLRRLTGVSWRMPTRIFAIALLSFLYAAPINQDAAYQINYLWSSVFISAFLVAFFSHRRWRWWAWPLLMVLGFCAGESNESFSGGLAIALAYLFIKRGFRMPAVRWMLSLTFGAGLLVNVLAPATAVRMQSPSAPFGIATLLNIFYYSWMLVPLALLLWWRQRRTSYSVREYLRTNMFYVVAACATLLSIWAVGIVYINSCMGIRYLILILLLRGLPPGRLRARWCVLLAALGAATLLWTGIRTREEAMKYGYIRDVYFHRSPDGIVELPAPLFGHDYRRTALRSLPAEWERRHADPSAPPIQVWPQGLKSIPADRDTNLVRRLGPDTWMMVQGKQHPRTFRLTRFFNIGPLRIPWSSRLIDFSPQGLGYVTETRAWRCAVFHNTHSYIYDVEIEMTDK